MKIILISIAGTLALIGVGALALYIAAGYFDKHEPTHEEL